jgi:hypothetical protein
LEAGLHMGEPVVQLRVGSKPTCEHARDVVTVFAQIWQSPNIFRN